MAEEPSRCKEARESWERGNNLALKYGLMTILHVRAPSGKMHHMVTAIDPIERKIVPFGIVMPQSDLKKFKPADSESDLKKVIDDAIRVFEENGCQINEFTAEMYRINQDEE